MIVKLVVYYSSNILMKLDKSVVSEYGVQSSVYMLLAGNDTVPIQCAVIGVLLNMLCRVPRLTCVHTAGVVNYCLSVCRSVGVQRMPPAHRTTSDAPTVAVFRRSSSATDRINAATTPTNANAVRFVLS